MTSRFEYNIQSGKRIEIPQIVYRDDLGVTIALDTGINPPAGFIEFTGDLAEESDAEPVEN